MLKTNKLPVAIEDYSSPNWIVSRPPFCTRKIL